MLLATKLSFPLVFSSILAALVGCGSSTLPAQEEECAARDVPGCVVASAKSRLVAPPLPLTDVEILVHGNTAFAFDLYREVAAEPGNVFFAPFSISESLALTSAGARGATESQMTTALHLDLPPCRIHAAFNALEGSITKPKDPGKGSDGGAFQLTFASALFDQAGYPIALPFLDTLAQSYGAAVHVVDFVGAPEVARATINGWMHDHSGQWIDDLLQPGSITTTMRMVLGSAVHFSAAWKTPFVSADTRFAAFTRRDGSTVQVPTMTATQNLSYGEGEDYAAVKLPYDAGDLAMILLLPSQGGLDALESSLSPEGLTSIVAGLDTRTVAVELPMFKIEASLGLAAPLAHLGMQEAFSDNADFSGMSGTPGLSLDEVIHQTFVDVDEAGTEAAASVSTAFTTTSAYLPATIHFERPYLFLVRDGVTGSILFLGRVDDPSI